MALRVSSTAHRRVRSTNSSFLHFTLPWATRLRTLCEALPVLESLKDDNMKDFDKKKVIGDILGSVSNDHFAQLIDLSKKVTDYNAEDESMADPDMEKKDGEIDGEVGVAVVFDEEEQEEEDEEGFEIRIRGRGRE